MRKDRSFNQMREISFEKNVNIHAVGSCLVKFGNTHVLCLATIDEKVPHWLKNTAKAGLQLNTVCYQDQQILEWIERPQKESSRVERKKYKG